MNSLSLPRETREFLFDDVVACTSSADDGTSTQDGCVSADNIIEFLNRFYGGAQVVSPELADHIREKSGSDASFTRGEFEAVFSPGEENLDT